MKPTPTPRELEILKVLWEQGPSSVRSVHRQLARGQDEDLAYNTVQTLLRIMEDKGLVIFRDGSPTPERGGRAKRFVTVTDQGRNGLVNAQAAYRSLLDGLDLLAEPIRYRSAGHRSCWSAFVELAVNK